MNVVRVFVFQKVHPRKVFRGTKSAVADEIFESNTGQNNLRIVRIKNEDC